MKIPFYQTVEKRGRIQIPQKLLDYFKIRENEFIFVEVQKIMASNKVSAEKEYTYEGGGNK